MAGLIMGFFGFQRSGKTLLSCLIANEFNTQGIPVYTNMNVEGFTHINSLEEVPFNFEPKILLLDEAYFFMDSRMWDKNSKSSIFFNTIGKQNILLMLTAISPDMIEKRLREQMNYIFIAKSNKNIISYKVIDVIRRKSKVFYLQKTEELFKKVKYDTLQVPDFLDCNINFIEKFNKKKKIKF